MEKRIYIAKQEKGNDIASVAYEVTDMFYKDPNKIDVDPVLYADDVYDVSLTDRYWEVRITTDRTKSCPITHENSDYMFFIGKDYIIGLKEVYMIM